MRRAGQSAADHGAFSGLTLNHCEFGYHPIAPAKRLKRVDRSSDGIGLRRALARDRETELIRVMVESIRYRRLAGGGSAGWRSGTVHLTSCEQCGDTTFGGHALDRLSTGGARVPRR